ncbi:MAG: hypothetical protein IPJ65_15965 [Archangiaceae bacterium]|nr:hypothetical protein [Archangiaceae bacterium]
MTALALWLAVAAGQTPQNEHDEASMFGGETPAEAASNAVANGLDGGAREDARGRDDVLFGGGDLLRDGGADRRDESMLGAIGKNRFDTGEEKNDPLKIGGTLYLRGQAYWPENGSFDKVTFSSPDLLDVYLDAQPIDRVRGVAVGRLLYEPTRSSDASASGFSGGGLSTVTAPQGNPAVYLDQLYLRFDIARTVFVTVGRQKMKWGTAHIWNPTDALNAQRRDPLQPFDLRLGVNAVKLHLPIEKYNWNFYAYGLLDNNGPANTLGKLGGALRAEIVIPKVRAEIGLDGAWVQGKRPRYGIDISVPLPDPIPIDLFGEVAFRDGRDFTIRKLRDGVDPATNPFGFFTEEQGKGIVPQVAAGLSLSIPYLDVNVLTVGLEYFYNPVGVSSPKLYPILFAENDYTAFYAAQHYGAAFVLLGGLPNAKWISGNFTVLMNFSDLSGLARLDAFFRVLTYLQIETFVAVNFGTRGGELRPYFPPIALPGGALTPFSPAPAASFGLGLRVNI